MDQTNINDNRQISIFRSVSEYGRDELHWAIAPRKSEYSLRAYLGPGRLLGEYTQWLGQKLEESIGTWAHYLGYGPFAKATQIEKMFGDDPKEVEKRLDVLYSDISGCFCAFEERKWLDALQQRCDEMMAYTLPSQTPEAQADAFQSILLHVDNGNCNQETEQSISSIWKRSDRFCDGVWKFYQPLAIASLSGNEITKLVEESKLDELFVLSDRKSSTVEKLLLLHDDLTVPAEHRVLCIRYLTGLLRLTYYWEYPFYSTWPITKKLMEAACQLFEDIFNSLPLLRDQEPNETLFDEDGVDMFMETLLLGLNKQATTAKLSDFSQDWLTQLKVVIDMIERPEITCLKRTYNVRTQIPGIYEDFLMEESQFYSADIADGVRWNSNNQENDTDSVSILAPDLEDIQSVLNQNNSNGEHSSVRPGRHASEPATVPLSSTYKESSSPVRIEAITNTNSIDNIGSPAPLTESLWISADGGEAQSVSDNNSNGDLSIIDSPSTSTGSTRQESHEFGPASEGLSGSEVISLPARTEIISNANNLTNILARLAALPVVDSLIHLFTGSRENTPSINGINMAPYSNTTSIEAIKNTDSIDNIGSPAAQQQVRPVSVPITRSAPSQVNISQQAPRVGVGAPNMGIPNISQPQLPLNITIQQFQALSAEQKRIILAQMQAQRQAQRMAGHQPAQQLQQQIAHAQQSQAQSQQAAVQQQPTQQQVQHPQTPQPQLQPQPQQQQHAQLMQQAQLQAGQAMVQQVATSHPQVPQQSSPPPPHPSPVNSGQGQVSSPRHGSPMVHMAGTSTARTAVPQHPQAQRPGSTAAAQQQAQPVSSQPMAQQQEQGQARPATTTQQAAMHQAFLQGTHNMTPEQLTCQVATGKRAELSANTLSYDNPTAGSTASSVATWGKSTEYWSSISVTG
ncbi:hypothetical protein M422DRAFT_776537 [Sphaerobolus stellatus SS14]|nr:hypothetical protein M422DRAFT_776537 [Sphaerobolus stellatus SS14]